MFLHYTDIVIFVTGYFILTHPVHNAGYLFTYYMLHSK